MLDPTQKPKLTKKATMSCGWTNFLFLTVFLFWLLRNLPQSEKFVFRRCALTQTSKEMVWIQADHTSHHLRPASQQQNISHKKSGGCSGTKLDCLELLTLTPLKYTWCIFHKLLSIFCIFVHITVWAVLKTSILRQMHLEHLKKRSAVSYSQMHLPIFSQFWSGAKVSRTRIMKWKICILHFVKRS